MGKIKNKILTAAITIAGGFTANSMIESAASETPKPLPAAKEIVKKDKRIAPPRTPTKRKPQKVYHSFAEIPAISDEEAVFYSKKEYSYIINANKYQATGKVEIKRVLTAELPSLNILSPTYYRECHPYTPKPLEDPKVIYDLDPRVISPNGTYKGPTQMDNNSVTNFMKYLLANSKTRKYVLPLFKTSDNSSLNKAALNLQSLFFAADGSPKSIKECKNVLGDKSYTLLKIKGDVTQAYKKLTASMPQKLFLSELEKYQLRFFGIGRSGQPQEIIEAVAKRMNYKIASGKPNATRVSLCVMGAAYCHVNWKGNGLAALNDAKSKSNPNNLSAAKRWVNGNGTNGVIALSEQSIITPQIINQYMQIGLSGADELNALYKQAVDNQEKRKRIAQNKMKALSPITQNNQTLLLNVSLYKRQKS